ncbi:Ionotropic receptor 357 [Blattella germanica]|nr:Ionotropic receptor 357 [Blattella germanica]
MLSVMFIINGNKADISRHDIEISIEQHLSELIFNITETYFDPNFPIAAQTPATWYPQHDWKKNYGDILLQMLHYYSHVPKVTLGYKDIEYSVYFLRTGNSVQPGSYVLLIAKPKNEVDEYFIQRTFDRFSYDTYSPKGKFIIAINFFPQNYLHAAFYFFYQALCRGFINVILLIPKATSKRSEALRMKQIDIYGWAPDEQNNICIAEVDKINHLDSWDVEMKAFVKKSNRFPKKKLTNMKYCKIYGLLGYLPPFLFHEGIMHFGSFIELILEYCDRFKCQFQTVFSSKKSHINFPAGYGQNHKSRECEFLYPYFVLDFTWYVPSGTKVEQWKSLFKAFTVKMWLLVIVTSVIGILFLWYLEKTTIIFRNNICKVHNDLLSIAIFGIGVNGRKIGIGYGFFLTLWLFYTLLINTAYQSTLFGLMIDPGEYPPIKTLAELKDSGLEMRSLVKIMGDKGFDIKNDDIESSNDSFIQIAENRNLSVFYSTYCGELDRQAKLLVDRWGKPKVVPLEDIIRREYAYGQVRFLSCLIHDNLNTLLHRAWSFGLIQHWNKEYREWWLKNYPEQNMAIVTALSIWHFQGAFYIFGIGVFVAVAIFVVEILVSPFYNTR